MDLKGAPLKPEFYNDLFPLLKQLGFSGILMEYEDMFPYNGQLALLARAEAYDPKTIDNIQQLATENNLQIIPLIQTFGHMEFALKHEKFSMLRRKNGTKSNDLPLRSIFNQID